MNDVDAELQEFLTYVEDTTDTFATQTTSPLVKEIQEKVRKVKANKELEVEYMTLYMRDRENREIGLEEGREKERENGIEILILDNVENGFDRDTIIAKVVKRYQVDEDTATAYYEKYAAQPV